MRRPLLTISLVSAVFLSAAACSDTASEPPGPDGSDQGDGDKCPDDGGTQPFSFGMEQKSPSGLSVKVESDPPVPSSYGFATWTLRITDAGGQPVTGAPVKVTGFMTHTKGFSHGFRPAAEVTELGGGDYKATPLNFSMTGVWTVTIEVGAEDAQESVKYRLCIR